MSKSLKSVVIALWGLVTLMAVGWAIDFISTFFPETK